MVRARADRARHHRLDPAALPRGRAPDLRAQTAALPDPARRRAPHPPRPPPHAAPPRRLALGPARSSTPSSASKRSPPPADPAARGPPRRRSTANRDHGCRHTPPASPPRQPITHHDRSHHAIRHPTPTTSPNPHLNPRPTTVTDESRLGRRLTPPSLRLGCRLTPVSDLMSTSDSSAASSAVLTVGPAPVCVTPGVDVDCCCSSD